MLEVSYGFVKPDAYDRRREIKEMLLDIGLQIILEKDPYFFTEELARRHYEPIRDRPWFEDAVRLALSGPTNQLLLLGEDTIQKLYDVVGHTDPQQALPNTIRRRFGTVLPYNAFHRSDSKSNVFRESFLHFKEEEMPTTALDILKTYA